MADVDPFPFAVVHQSIAGDVLQVSPNSYVAFKVHEHPDFVHAISEYQDPEELALELMEKKYAIAAKKVIKSRRK